MPTSAISAVVPAYNVEKFLARCLTSLLRQSVPPSEILVIVDGSTDGSLQIARDFEARHPSVRVIDQENVGLGATRNRGIREATGDYVIFVDSDDALRKDALELISSRIAESRPDMISYRFSYWHANGARVPQIRNLTLAGRTELRGADTDLLLSNPLYFAWASAYRRDFLLEHQVLNGEGYLFEDQEFTIGAILEAQRIALIDEPLYWYYSNPESILRNPSLEMSQRRVEGRTKSIDALREATRTRRASERAKAYLADHEYVDLASFYTRDGHPYAVRIQFLQHIAEFFADVEPADTSLLQTGLRRLYEEGAIQRRDLMAISDALYEELSEEYARVTSSLAYRVARKLGNIGGRLMSRVSR